MAYDHGIKKQDIVAALKDISEKTITVSVTGADRKRDEPPHPEWWPWKKEQLRLAGYTMKYELDNGTEVYEYTNLDDDIEALIKRVENSSNLYSHDACHREGYAYFGDALTSMYRYAVEVIENNVGGPDRPGYAGLRTIMLGDLKVRYDHATKGNRDRIEGRDDS